VYVASPMIISFLAVLLCSTLVHDFERRLMAKLLEEKEATRNQAFALRFRLGAARAQAKKKKTAMVNAVFGPGPIGVTINQIANSKTTGGRVHAVDEGSQAAKQGVVVGAILMTVNGERVTIGNGMELARKATRPMTMSFEYEIAQVKAVKKRPEQTVEKRREEPTEQPNKITIDARFGPGPLGFTIAQIPNATTTGGRVKAVRWRSQAEKQGVKKGSVLMAVNGELVTDGSGTAILSDARRKSTRPVTISFECERKKKKKPLHVAAFERITGRITSIGRVALRPEKGDKRTATADQGQRPPPNAASACHSGQSTEVCEAGQTPCGMTSAGAEDDCEAQEQETAHLVRDSSWNASSAQPPRPPPDTRPRQHESVPED
jgi:hypothetical protein